MGDQTLTPVSSSVDCEAVACLETGASDSCELLGYRSQKVATRQSQDSCRDWFHYTYRARLPVHCVLAGIRAFSGSSSGSRDSFGA